MEVDQGQAMKVILRGGRFDGQVVEIDLPDFYIDYSREQQEKKLKSERREIVYASSEFRPSGEIDAITGLPIWREVV